MKEPYIITKAKETFKDLLIKYIKGQRKPLITRISPKTVTITEVTPQEDNGVLENVVVINHIYTNEVNVVTEISRKKDGIKRITVKTDINLTYLLPI